MRALAHKSGSQAGIKTAHHREKLHCPHQQRTLALGPCSDHAAHPTRALPTPVADLIPHAPHHPSQFADRATLASTPGRQGRSQHLLGARVASAVTLHRQSTQTHVHGSSWSRFPQAHLPRTTRGSGRPAGLALLLQLEQLVPASCSAWFCGPRHSRLGFGAVTRRHASVYSFPQRVTARAVI